MSDRDEPNQPEENARRLNIVTGILFAIFTGLCARFVYEAIVLAAKGDLTQRFFGGLSQWFVRNDTIIILNLGAVGFSSLFFALLSYGCRKEQPIGQTFAIWSVGWALALWAVIALQYSDSRMADAYLNAISTSMMLLGA